jgi:hypothetical protein
MAMLPQIIKMALGQLKQSKRRSNTPNDLSVLLTISKLVQVGKACTSNIFDIPDLLL